MEAFKSILFDQANRELNNIQPQFFADLQLDYLLKIIENQAHGYDIRPYFFTLPSTIENIHYRQEIYQDLRKNQQIRQAIQSFCLELFRSRRSFDNAKLCEEKVQSASYHLEAAVLYVSALRTLDTCFSSIKLQSDGLSRFYLYITEKLNYYDKIGLFAAIDSAKEFLNEMKFSLSVSEQKITVDENTNESKKDFLDEIKKTLQQSAGYCENMETTLGVIFPNALENSHLETILVRLLQKNKPDIFEQLLNFYQKFPEFYDETILLFEKEIQFYLSFYVFEEKTNQYGYYFQIPHITNQCSFGAEGLYDLALVWKNAMRNTTVVTNDFSYPGHPSFFVVTGPNQGGKTTFARSVGQAVYFALMGLSINANQLELPFFSGISTHFEVEESVKSNSGKLKEEIDRLQPMMKHHIQNHFILLNELFTTATTYDALLMGKKVMQHFLQRQCFGIYVTHIQELAVESESIISMVAQIRDEETQERTYKIVPVPAQGYGYSEKLIKEYQLSYDDLMRRLP